MKLTVVCVGFKPLRSGTLVGFATVRITELHMTIADVTLHARNGKYRATGECGG
jgi:hypothetical protein